MTMAEGSSEKQPEEYELACLKNVSSEDAISDQVIESSTVNSNDMIDLKPHDVGFDDHLDNRIENIVHLCCTIKDYPILFDPKYDKPEKTQEIEEAWEKISREINWKDKSPISSVWSDVLNQYTYKRPNGKRIRKDSSEINLNPKILDELQWIDEYLKDESSNKDDNDSLDRDVFYSDLTQNISEDVMISGCKPVISHSTPGYVVLQPSTNRSRSHQRIDTTNNQNSKFAASIDGQSNTSVRRLLLSNPSGGQYAQRQKDSQPSRQIPEGQLLQVIKKDDSTNSGTMTMMVDTTTYFQNGNGQKVYRLFTIPQNQSSAENSNSPSSASQGQTMNIQQRRNNSQVNVEYELLPEPLIESSADQPPRKKMAMQRSPNNNYDGQPGRNKLQMGDGSIIEDGMQDSSIVIDQDRHLHEESPLLSASPDVMISGQSVRSNQSKGGQDPISSNMASTSTIHQALEMDRQRDLNDIHEVVVDGTQDDYPQSMQYDSDLAFQQMISQHLSRLSEDDKALMKYNMQRILLDARFGDGTAKQLMAEDILENQDVVHEETLGQSSTSPNQS